MEFFESDIVMKYGEAEFGAVHFGDSATLAVVKVEFPDGRRWIVSPNKTRMSDDYIENVAMQVRAKALRLAANKAADRFLPEAIAYVRSLPNGRKSNFLASTDRSLLKEAVSDVHDALVAAIETREAYRASVEFEKRVPYLVADRGLVDVMDSIIGTFSADYDEAEWVAAVAEETQENLRKHSPFMSAQIASWETDRDSSGSLSAH